MNLKRINKRVAWGLALLITALIALRLALPGWLMNRVNEELAEMGDYSGQIEDLDMQLWAGAYTLENLQVVKTTGEVPLPFIYAPITRISISWSALWHGSIVAMVDMEGAELNFVDDENGATQSGLGVNWHSKLESLAPFRLDEVRIHDGLVRFSNFSTEPAVSLEASQVEARVNNLTNIRDTGSARAADCELTATVLEQASLLVECVADPYRVLQDFRLKLKLTSLELKNLNEFLKAYAHLDVQSGQGEFIMELEARDGQLNGYAKPLFRDIQVFSWEQDIEQQDDNLFEAAWEAIVGGVENPFKNQQENQLATRVEISGSINDADTDTLEVIAGILKNAFIEAYRPQFEGLPARDTTDTET